MGYALGIDLGTTYTAAAVYQDGRVETVGLGSHANTIPTVAYARESGEVLVGEAALARGLNDPGRFAKEFKRRLGSDTPIVLGGATFAVEDLLGEVLSAVMETVTSYYGGAPDRVVVTHPASWADHRLDRLGAAAAQAEIEGCDFAAEPVAASVFYSSQERVPDDAVIAVYDLGGGTFDASVLRKSDVGFELVARPEGDDSIGGVDFDRAVLEHVAASLGDSWTGLDLTDGAVATGLEQLRRSATGAKELLSDDLEVTVPVALPGLNRDVRMTRGEFEERIRPDVESTLDTMQRALDNARLPAETIHTVLLVGGSSRVPLVGEVIGNGLGLPLAIDAHPKLAICQGAALIAAHRAGLLEPEPEPEPEPLASPPPEPAPPEPEPVAPSWRDHLTPRNLGVGAGVLAALVLLATALANGDSGGSGQGPGTSTVTTDTPVTTETSEPPGSDQNGTDETPGERGFAFAVDSLAFIDQADDPTGGMDGVLLGLRASTPFELIADRDCASDTIDRDLLSDGIEQLRGFAAASPDPELTRRYGLAIGVYEDLSRRCTEGGNLLNIRGGSAEKRADQTEGYVADWLASIRTCADGGPETTECGLIAAMVALEVVDLEPPVEFGPLAFTPLFADGSVWFPMNGRPVPPDDERSAQFVRIDAETGATLGIEELPVGAETPLFADGRLWVPTVGPNVVDGLVHLVDPSTGERVDQVEVGANPYTPQLGDGFVFVPNRGDGTVTRIDPEDLATTTIDIAGALEAVDPDAVGVRSRLGGSATEVWAGTAQQSGVARIDPATGDVLQVFSLPAPPWGMVEALGSMWVSVRDGTEGSVVRFDLSDLDAAPEIIELGAAPRNVIGAEGSLWVGTSDGQISRIDPSTNRADPVVDVGSELTDGVPADGFLWYSSTDRGVLIRLDPRDPDPPLIIPISFGSDPGVPAGHERIIWVPVEDQSTVVRVAPAEAE